MCEHQRMTSGGVSQVILLFVGGGFSHLPPPLIFIYVYEHSSVWMCARACCGEKRALILRS